LDVPDQPVVCSSALSGKISAFTCLPLLRRWHKGLMPFPLASTNMPRNTQTWTVDNTASDPSIVFASSKELGPESATARTDDEIEVILLGTGTSSALPHLDCLTAPPEREPCRTCTSTLRPEGRKNVLLDLILSDHVCVLSDTATRCLP
jgi:hypothetical protein